MKRALLTGATGFVGRTCISPLVQRGFDVHVITSSSTEFPDDVHWHRCDLLDEEQVNKTLKLIQPTHLLHSAWNVKGSSYWNSDKNIAWLAASISLIRSFAETGGQRAVGVGTCAEYRWSEACYRELQSPLVPATSYGACKLAASAAFAGAKAMGLSTAWGRIFFPYGPHEQPERLLSTVIRGLLRGTSVDCTEAIQIRDYIYVDDVGAALAAVLDSPVEGAVNVGSGRGQPLRTLIEMAIKELGSRHLIRYGALPLRQGDPMELVADVTRLRTEVGFQPSIEVEEGVKRAIKYWRDHPSYLFPNVS